VRPNQPSKRKWSTCGAGHTGRISCLEKWRLDLAAAKSLAPLIRIGNRNHERGEKINPMRCESSEGAKVRAQRKMTKFVPPLQKIEPLEKGPGRGSADTYQRHIVDSFQTPEAKSAHAKLSALYEEKGAGEVCGSPL
jgi:hypothetical protein